MSRRRLDPLLVKVMAAIHQTAETPPKGFRTIEEWAKVWNMERTAARVTLHKGVSLGLIEKRTFRIVIRKDAKPYPVAHYGEKTRPRKT
jgi:Fic family protein